MWKELLSIFSNDDGPVHSMGVEFDTMLAHVQTMSSIVEPHALDLSLSDEARGTIYATDVEVNKLERSIRKRVISHLSIGGKDVAYCLLLMTLVKDVERIGDYLKNISEVSTLGGTLIPEGPLRDELASLIKLAHNMIVDAPEIMKTQDTTRAAELLRVAKAAAKRCDELLVALSLSKLDAGETTAMVLLTRFYKRIGGHLLNILSSVVMPLHKVDYYDERYLDDPAKS